jgi:hypothetical protein
VLHRKSIDGNEAGCNIAPGSDCASLRGRPKQLSDERMALETP